MERLNSPGGHFGLKTSNVLLDKGEKTQQARRGKCPKKNLVATEK